MKTIYKVCCWIVSRAIMLFLSKHFQPCFIQPSGVRLSKGIYFLMEAIGISKRPRQRSFIARSPWRPISKVVAQHRMSEIIYVIISSQRRTHCCSHRVSFARGHTHADALIEAGEREIGFPRKTSSWRESLTTVGILGSKVNVWSILRQKQI